MAKYLTASVIVLFLQIISLPTIASAENTLPQQAYDTIGSAVFEVVVAKPAKDSLKYKDPLPFNALPFAIRNDRYYSIGTAFAIAPNQFVSAAHVMNLGTESQWGEPLLRDRNGTVYPIDRITKYSEHRDFIVFTVKDLTVNKPFEINKNPTINQPVFAVGNALGEGVVIRDGRYTSDTLEEEDGAWKWLRFSAAASPGNSGGPLLDTTGRVIGVVLRKSPNENLNFALPISEVATARDNMAQIHRKTWYSLPIMTRSKGATRASYLSLPMPYQQLNRELTEYALIYQYQDQKNYFLDIQEKLFPNGAGSKPILASIPSTAGPSLLRMKDDGYWESHEIQSTSVELGQNGWIAYGDLGDSFVFTLHKPDNVSLDQIYSDGKLFMDMVLRGIRLSRNVGDNPIRITSFGPPQESYTFRDHYGRIWLVKTWLREFDDTKVVTFSLPTPEGVMSLMRIGQTGAVESIHIPTLKTVTNFIGFSYSGNLKEWGEFTQYKDLLPPALTRLELSRKNGDFVLSSSKLAVTIGNDVMQLSDHSVLSLLMGYTQNNDTVTWDICSTMLFENQNISKMAVITRHTRPALELNTEFHTLWETISTGKFPYNRSAYSDNGSTRIMSLVESDGHKNPDSLHTLFYAGKGMVEQETMLAIVDKLRLGVTIIDGGNKAKSGEGNIKQDVTAYGQYQRIMQEDPKSALRYALQGQIHLENNDSDRSAQSLAKAIAINPGCEAAYNARGMMHLKQGDLYRAMDDYGKAVEINPLAAESFNNRGDIFLKRGRHNEAIEELTKALAINAKMSVAYNNRAKAYIETKRYGLALNDYTRVIELDPHNSDSYYNRGNLYRTMKDYDRAISDFDRAIEFDDKSALAYYGRGFLYAEMKEYDKAMSDYMEAIRRKPDYLDAYLNRGLIYKQRAELRKAIEDFTKAIEIEPRHVPAYVNRGNCLLISGEKEKAFADFDTALKIDPRNVDAHTMRGYLHRQKGDTLQALDDLDRAIALAPDHWYAYFLRGVTHGMKGALDNSLADLDRAVDLEPKNAEIYNSRGFTLFLRKEFIRALADYNRSIEIDPKTPLAYQNRGNLYASEFRDAFKACQDWKTACDLGLCVNLNKARQLKFCR